MLATTLMIATAYQGVELDCLVSYLYRRPPGADPRDALRKAGACSPASLPLYYHLLTTPPYEPPPTTNEGVANFIRQDGVRLRWLAMGMVREVEADRSAFVPVGIGLLNDPNYSDDAQMLLRDIAAKANLPALRKAVNLEDKDKKLGAVGALWVLAMVGEEEDLKLFDKAAEVEHIRRTEGLLDRVDGAREILVKRLAKAKGEKK